jgi:hypothetical protein
MSGSPITRLAIELEKELQLPGNPKAFCDMAEALPALFGMLSLRLGELSTWAEENGMSGDIAGGLEGSAQASSGANSSAEQVQRALRPLSAFWLK